QLGQSVVELLVSCPVGGGSGSARVQRRRAALAEVVQDRAGGGGAAAQVGGDAGHRPARVRGGDHLPAIAGLGGAGLARAAAAGGGALGVRFASKRSVECGSYQIIRKLRPGA